MIDHNEVAKKLARFCYSPRNGEGSTEHLLQTFIEAHVLPRNVTSYTEDDMREYIYQYLVETMAGFDMFSILNKALEKA